MRRVSFLLLLLEVVFMRMHSRELEEGYILKKDILGKTGKPIVPKQTILTDKHIHFIQSFLVEYVDVSPQTIDGETVQPSQQLDKEVKKDQPTRDIRTLYQDTVSFMMSHFKKWEQHFPIDMPSIRHQIVPLLDRVEEEQAFLYSIHEHATKDEYIYHHSVAVSMLATYLARKIGYNHGESIQIGLGALFSDSGMTQIDGGIRTSTQELSVQELQLVHEHPLYSYRFVEPIQTLNQGAKVAVLQHHERLNGTGYPLGVQGKRIHPYTHIISVCDMYHAMVSERPYRQKRTIYQACEGLWEARDVSLKGSVIEAFVEEFAPISLGNHVTLSNGSSGKVVFIDPSEPLRPTIQLHDTSGLCSLQDDRTIFMVEVIV